MENILRDGTIVKITAEQALHVVVASGGLSTKYAISSDGGSVVYLPESFEEAVTGREGQAVKYNAFAREGGTFGSEPAIARVVTLAEDQQQDEALSLRR